MSSSMRLLRSPKPGALTAMPVKVPRSLLTIRVAVASPSTSSAMIKQRLVGLDDPLEHRHQVLHRGDLAVVDEDVGILKHGFLAVGVGDHVRAHVAAVELHAFGEIELDTKGLAFFDVDHAVFADLLDRIGDHIADGTVTGGDRRHAGDVFLAGDLFGLCEDRSAHALDGGLDATLEAHRVGARGNVFQALAHDRLGEQGCRRGAVAGHVVGGGGHLAHELCTLVFKRVAQLDLTGDGHTVVGDRGGAKALVEHHVAALGAEGYLDRVSEGVDPALQGPAGFFGKQNVLCHLSSPPWRARRPHAG